jgi:undecaprenyl diphosphate synthase
MGFNLNNNKMKHVAIIMDGNGRWANMRSHARIWGHIRGSTIVSDIVEAASDNGVKALTLYTFSSENWSRPALEVTILFKLLQKFLLKERKRLIANKIIFRVAGNICGLPLETQKLINQLSEETKNAEGMILTFAFDYGGRKEITSVMNRYIVENPGQKITEEIISSMLFTPEYPDVDLLIRTGGDQRISNFLLWQSAYAELYFSKTLWPDFSTQEFLDILGKFQLIERRFGTLSGYQDKIDNLNYTKASRLAEQNRLNYIENVGQT